MNQSQLHHQGFLVPLDPARLVVPVLAGGGELHVEAPEHACEDEAHFEVCETVFFFLVSGALRGVERGGGRREKGKEIKFNKAQSTYFLPMQLRGPIEKGWEASLLSPAKRLSPSQRSGQKTSGSVKLAVLR